MERLVELTLLVFLCLLFTSCMRYSVRELREEGIGRTSQDIDINRIIRGFFKRHSR